MFSPMAMKFLTRSNNTAAAAFRRKFHGSLPCWQKLNVEGLAKKVDLEGKNVLVRVDLNVPLAKVCGSTLYHIVITAFLLMMLPKYTFFVCQLIL